MHPQHPAWSTEQPVGNTALSPATEAIFAVPLLRKQSPKLS